MCNLFKRKQSPSPLKPIIRAEITLTELYALLRKKFPDSYIFLSDTVKYLCDIEDINTFLEQDHTNRMKYVSEKFDCDDFAYRLMGQFSIPGWSELAKAIVWTDRHALNAFVDTNGEWWFIEPQTDDIKNELVLWQGSEVRLIMM